MTSGRPMTNCLSLSVDQPKAVAVIREVDGLVVARLFGQGPWLCDRETAFALHKKFLDWGLSRELPNNATTNTDFGEQLNVGSASNLHWIVVLGRSTAAARGVRADRPRDLRPTLPGIGAWS